MRHAYVLKPTFRTEWWWYSIFREVPAVVPAGHVLRIGWVERTGAGELAQYAPTHLLLSRGEAFRCQRDHLGEVDLHVLAHRKQRRWMAICWMSLIFLNATRLIERHEALAAV